MLPEDVGSKNKFKSAKERHRSYISLLLVGTQNFPLLVCPHPPPPHPLHPFSWLLFTRLTSICPALSTALKLRIGVPK